MLYIIKLSAGVRSEGRTVDGEYDGGATLLDARREAVWFNDRSAGGAIEIKRVLKGGGLSHVETTR